MNLLRCLVIVFFISVVIKTHGQPWKYETIYGNKIVYDYAICDNNKIIGLDHELLNIETNKVLKNSYNGSYLWIKKYEKYYLAYEAPGTVLWLENNEVIGESKFIDYEEVAIEGVKNICEGNNHIFLLTGKEIYFIEKASFTASEKVIKANTINLKNYKGFGTKYEIIVYKQDTLLLSDDGVYKIKPKFKKKRYLTKDKKQAVKHSFKKYVTKKISKRLKKQKVTSSIVLNGTSKVILGGSDLWILEDNNCAKVDFSECYYKPSFGHIYDMEMFEDKVWIVSEIGLGCYDVEKSYYIGDSKIADVTRNAKLSVINGSLYLCYENGLSRIETNPEHNGKTTANMMIVHINGFLRNRADSLKHSKWDFARHFIETYYKDEKSHSDMFMFNKFPKQGYKWTDIYGMSDLNNQLDSIGNYLTGHRVDKTIGTRKIFKFIDYIMGELDERKYLFDELNIIVLTDRPGMFDFEDIKLLKKWSRFCQTQFKVYLISTKHILAMPPNCEKKKVPETTIKFVPLAILTDEDVKKAIEEITNHDGF